MQNFNWSEAKTGYTVDCIFMIEGSCFYSIENFNFSLDEYSKIKNLVDAIDNAENYSVTDMKRIIIQRSMSDNETSKLKMLENLKNESLNETIVGYRIIKNDHTGVSYAMYNGKPYKKLTETSESCFNNWDCEYSAQYE